jgi:hypothetical protein
MTGHLCIKDLHFLAVDNIQELHSDKNRFSANGVLGLAPTPGFSSIIENMHT